MTTTFKRRKVSWDIETGPESDEILRKFYEPLADFSEEACKAEYATARDAAKGPAFIAKKKAEHEAAKVEHWEKYRANAALSPMTGRILVIGIRENGVARVLVARTDEEEKAIIAEFLAYVAEVMAGGGVIEGFNTDQFDLPFVFRRGLKYRLNVHLLRNGRYWHPIFRDLLAVWQAGDRTKFISLNTLAEYLGTRTRKNGDGRYFYVVFAEDPDKAIAYAKNDLVMTEEVGEAMTPLPAPGHEEEDMPFATPVAA